MISGRHLVLVGVLACCGLLTVRDGQRQIDICYRIAGMEKDLREVREEIELNRTRHTALQSPKAVEQRAVELKLPVGPQSSELALLDPLAPKTEAPRSLGSAAGARRAPERPTTGSGR